ncbi:hypothetical protein [Amycolatopsis sp. NPDC004625]|uniref:hypothetical protein n=1 Tax=Amycolatopsis sp. NPDC004625 TaxID=3154670 RepID=UPI00339DF561
MIDLTEPPDDAQRALLSIVWPLFAKHRQFPVFRYVEIRMRKLGMDAFQVLESFPSIGINGYRGRYGAVWTEWRGGAHPLPESPVCLTMAGLYHLDDEAKPIINIVLTYLRTLSTRSEVLAEQNPFGVVEAPVTIDEVFKSQNFDLEFIPSVAAIVEHESPWFRVTPNSEPGQITGELGVLTDANFYSIEEYIDAISALTVPQQPTATTNYINPLTLSRAITSLDVTCELVLKRKLIKKPAVDRTARFALDAASHGDLQAGLSALGEILSELDVPGKKTIHPTGRLLDYLTQELPNADKGRIEGAIAAMEAVRVIRNSGQYPKPNTQLLQAHDHLGLPFPVREPIEAWNVIRAQINAAFTILQEEIYAAR